MADIVFLDVCKICGGLIDGENYILENNAYPCFCGVQEPKPNAVESNNEKHDD